MRCYHIMASYEGRPVVRHIGARSATEAMRKLDSEFPGCLFVVMSRDKLRFQSRCAKNWPINCNASGWR